MQKRVHGFTLIEVLVAATILAVLATIGFASYQRVSQRSRDSKRIGDLEQIRSALEMFRADKGYYPAQGAGAWVLADSGLTTDLVPTYMPAIPDDPKAVDPYVYWYQAANASGGLYYGYCLSGTLESSNPPTNSCTPKVGQNYGVKNP